MALQQKPDRAAEAIAGKERTERLFPLVPFNGEKPPAPAWFDAALTAPHTDGASTVEGADIVWRRWGEPGKRGLIFVHGGVAHLGWWDFIAPFFTDAFTPAALSLSGMGRSGRREHYKISLYADEVLTVAKEAGLFEGPEAPLIVGHSFGGFVTLATSVVHGEQFGGAVICDSPIRREKGEAPRSDPRRRGGRVYPDEAAALGRFSLMPNQECENLYLLDHIARNALKEATDEDGKPGVAWVHDPDLWVKMKYFGGKAADAVPERKCPVAFVRGENSALVTDERWEKMAELVGAETPRVSIPEAQHHLMLDQPLAFVSALRGLFGGWPDAEFLLHG
ncbi:MAG: alpha/beta hydrolase [Maricaulaceae bacterium]|jgi:pimeloyl-ACP methyl ester carboxylesterase